MINDHKIYFNSIASKRIKQRRRKKYYWDDVTRYCNYFIQEDTKVLEVGCGTGELLNEIKAINKTGIDFSEVMIDEARKQFPSLDLRVMSAEQIQFDKKFDLIILSNLVGYVNDIQVVFSQLHSVCHPHTKIIVTYYNFLWEPILKLGEWIGYKTKTPNQNWLSLTEINNLLFLSGFHVYRNSRQMILPVYIPILSELCNTVLAKLPLLRRLCINNYSFAIPASTKKEGAEKNYSVSIVVPARNESGNIENLIQRLPALGSSTEIIFVESNSSDNTWEVIQIQKEKYSATHNLNSIQITEKGKNPAVKKGFEIATGDIVMILDADLTVAPEDLPKVYNILANHDADFVNGCRLVYPIEGEAMRFLNLMGNKFFSSLFSWLLDQPLKDTLCGTKALFRKDYQRLLKNSSYFGHSDPFGDFDLLFGAHKLNLCIAELPVRYHERTYGRTNISRFKHGFILLKMCFLAARKIKFT
jgi:SAM-dependent methyltransferase